MKKLESIGAVLLILFSVVVSIFVAYIGTTRTLTVLESTLWQIFVFAAGLTGSFIFGRQSAREAAKEIIRPHARSAFRRLDSLYDSLARAAEVIESAQQPDVHEDYQVPLARLEEIVAGQLISADDAMEDWKDIFPDDVLDDWPEDWSENGLDNPGYILQWPNLKSQDDDTTEAKQ